MVKSHKNVAHRHRLSMCFAILVLQSRIIKNQEAVYRDIQCLRDGKQGVERDGLFDVRRLHMADEGRGAVDALGQLLLREPAQAAVVGDFQADLTVLLGVSRFHW